MEKYDLIETAYNLFDKILNEDLIPDEKEDLHIAIDGIMREMRIYLNTETNEQLSKSLEHLAKVMAESAESLSLSIGSLRRGFCGGNGTLLNREYTCVWGGPKEIVEGGCGGNSGGRKEVDG